MKLTLDGPLGSEGISLTRIGGAGFRAVLAPSRGLPLVPNMLQFRCRGCADTELEIETCFPVENPRGMFDEYPHAATADFERFLPLEWALPRNGAENLLRIPATGLNDFHVGMQAAYPNPVVERHLREWERHPFATAETVGHSIGGRPIHALRVRDPGGTPRWRHFVVNQHPGEGNARWRIKGLIDFLLSDAPGAAALREHAEFLVIPLLCPDGPANGWRRVNADGVDMNRCHRMEGPDAAQQTREAFLFQSLLEAERPDTLWCMHTWPGITEPILDGAGPEFGTRTGSGEELVRAFQTIGGDALKPLRIRETPGGEATWNGGPRRRLGLTTFLIEGGGEPADPAPHMQAGETLGRILADFWR